MAELQKCQTDNNPELIILEIISKFRKPILPVVIFHILNFTTVCGCLCN